MTISEAKHELIRYNKLYKFGDMKKNVFLLCVMVVSMMVASCGKDIDKENHPDGPIDERLIGSWEFDHLGNITQWDNHETWEFYSNGNCRRESIRENIHILYQWTAENNLLKLRYHDSNIELRYLISNGLLTFDTDMPEEKQTWYKKVK